MAMEGLAQACVAHMGYTLGHAGVRKAGMMPIFMITFLL